MFEKTTDYEWIKIVEGVENDVFLCTNLDVNA